MRGVGKKIRRNACVFLLALIFAYVFFEVGMLYQEKQNEKRQEQERNKGSMKTHRKESVRDISKKRDIVLKSLNDKLKEVTERKSNDAMILIGKLTSSPEKKPAEARRVERSDVLIILRKRKLKFSQARKSRGWRCSARNTTGMTNN